MKKTIYLIIIILFSLSVLCGCAYPPHTTLYSKSTVVVELNYSDDIVVCEDFNGNLWTFNGTEDWCVGDICSMIMSDNNTPDNIYDDTIEEVRYDGFVK